MISIIAENSWDYCQYDYQLATPVFIVKSYKVIRNIFSHFQRNAWNSEEGLSTFINIFTDKPAWKKKTTENYNSVFKV